ncbi:vomeronasal type-2 receptor 26-like [Lissotriton helveticus]
MDTMFNNRVLFPAFYRTVPSELMQHEVIIKLLKHFGWTWVGMIVSDDEISQGASEQLRTKMASNGICVAFSIRLIHKMDLETAMQIVRNSTANVIITYSNTELFYYILIALDITSVPVKVLIIPASLAFIAEGLAEPYLKHLNGSLIVSVPRREIPGLKEYLSNASPVNTPNNPFLNLLWYLTFSCYPNGTKKYIRNICEDDISLRTVGPAIYDVDNFRLTFSVYAAVHAVAQALHNLYFSDLEPGKSPNNLKKTFSPWQLNKYMQTVRFNSTGGDDIYFDETGSLPSQFDILNFVGTKHETFSYNKVGYSFSANGFQDIFLNESEISWSPHFTQTPISVCNPSCLPGYRKVPEREKQVCCYSCSPCPEGEISNQTDMENCIRCPKEQWPNERKDSCIPRTLELLSYEDPLGVALACSSVLLSVVGAGVLWIFIKNHHTALVRANNRDLSYILLISLILSFLCCLIFIGRPVKVTCLLRQTSFSIVFTIAVSSVLAKTITVVMAFNATKPGSQLRKWVGPRLGSSLVIVLSLGEVIICIAWIVLAPPFPDVDTSQIGKMILQCNDGSAIALYLVIGYIGVLALLSFLLAFFARRLPDSFNEAQLITFSMMVFCSVWVAFIPAHLSTKGKYMVAVEVFAILASTAGLLGCIFIPKCYIILLRSDLNKKEFLVGKK